MKRNTLILAALVVVLWGAWYLYSSEEKQELSLQARLDFFHADSLAVDSVAVKYATWCSLVRRDGRWDVVFPDWSYPADSKITSDIFRFTNEMVLENLISTKAEKHTSFQVDTVNGTQLRFFENGVPTAEFVMGKAGADMNHTYIRRLGSDSVYMARGDFQRVFRRVPTDWPTRLIFDVDTISLARISWISADTKVWVERDAAGGWRVFKEGAAAGLAVDTSVFNVRLRRMCPMKCDAFVIDTNAARADLASPHEQIIIQASDGRADTLLFNAPRENDNKRYAFHAGRPRPLFIFYQNSYDRIKGIYTDLVLKGGAKRLDTATP